MTSGVEDNKNNTTEEENEKTTTTTTNEECSNKNTTNNNNNNDFVIRDGFPALRTSEGKPLIEGVEPSILCCDDNNFVSYSSSFGKLLEDSKLCDMIHEDCKKVFTARTIDDLAAYSSGCTYFVPAIPTYKARCGLEALALSIFHQHTNNLPAGSFIPEQSGAEWWTLVLDADPPKKDEDTENDDDNEDEEDMDEHEEVGMHFDADYGLEDQVPGLLVHPRVATVTYLSDYGAPTLVLNQRSPTPDKALNGIIENGWLSSPKVGKHIAFDGRLLHGAPATFFPGITPPNKEEVTTDPPPAKKQKIEKGVKVEVNKQQRFTFMVNIWLNHCPIDAELLEDEIVQELQTPIQKLGSAFVLDDKPDTLESKSLKNYPEDPAGEEETIICENTVTLYYNEKMEKQHTISHDITNEKKSCQLVFTDKSLEIKTTTTTTTDDNDDDDKIQKEEEKKNETDE